ncbi:cytochrome P450 [Mycena metata]|uniref:Cytochrome P450 n=1 Tax=Mycena metata TaxID=1033252 RepID=A0AAD7ML93_9AGAR|nr:cytochrome P450 [Mycena metata]
MLMASLDLSSALLVMAALAVIIQYFSARRMHSRFPLPPGPKKLPIVGNLFNKPQAPEYEAYVELGRKLNSDIIHLNLAGQSVVNLLSSTVTDDLLEKRSALYSDRPSLPMYTDVIGWDFNFTFFKYGEKWRAHRRLFSETLNSAGSRRFRPQQLTAARKMLHGLLATPDDFIAHFRQMAGEFIINVAYGIKVSPVNDPYIMLAEEGIKAIEATIAGRFLVNTFPILRFIPEWFPGAGFKRQAREWRKVGHAMRDGAFDERTTFNIQQQMDTAAHSFTAEYLQKLNEGRATYYNEDTIKTTAATMYLGGADTVLSSFASFVLAMLANPAAQKRAQMEIDSVTGGKRLPNFDDEDALPYVSALCKEVLRWRPVAPGGLPHFLAVEDQYNGYTLPANSIIVPNIWSGAILHDEAMYPDPQAFKPERFLLDGKLNPNVRDPQAAFGFGRRICPGRFLAQASVFITVASILATFDITKYIGTNGQPVEPTYEYSSGIVAAPLPFKCSIRPRSGAAAALVEAGDSEDD